jgi:hypothetical protein
MKIWVVWTMDMGQTEFMWWLCKGKLSRDKEVKVEL